MSVSYLPKLKLFKLSTAHSDYIFKVTPGGRLNHLYYGPAVSDSALFASQNGVFYPAAFSAVPENDAASGTLDWMPQEFSGFNTGDMRCSSVAIHGTDGSLAAEPLYRRNRIFSGKKRLNTLPSAFEGNIKDSDTLEIDLEDPVTKVRFTLSYTVFEECDVIVRSVKVTNLSKKTVSLTRIMSVQIDFAGKDFDIITLEGSWARERTAERSRLTHGIRTIRSMRGSSSHNNNPAIALVSPDATEKFGEACGIILAYSGNFSSETELDQYGTVRSVIGINPEGFSWQLKPGAEFEAPEAILTYSAEGLGGMSRQFHDFFREHWLSPLWAHAKRPILINNWEATYFNFNDEKILDIAKAGSKMGLEMLVLDDGWFGSRNNDKSSLGDWFVNTSKLKSISDLAANINKLGMKFGLWFEPEMISPVSLLHNVHPEWVLHIPGRSKSLGRSQCVLDMARPEVVDYLFETISEVLHSANIEYMKWDMNRNLTEVYSAAYPAEQQGEIFHRYVLGVYNLYARLLREFPNLLIEGCSGGGGRFDAGILSFSPQIWCSDDSDAIMRLNIQRGTSLFYPASTMGAHVSVCPNHQTGRTVPFKTRGYVAFAGTFGYELDLTKLNDEDAEEVHRQVDLYHTWHDLVNDGDFYRLTPVGKNNPVEAWMFVGKSCKRAVLTAVRRETAVHTPAVRICLAGLEPGRKYKVRGGKQDVILYGDTLMNAGLLLDMLDNREYSSAFLTLEAVR